MFWYISLCNEAHAAFHSNSSVSQCVFPKCWLTQRIDLQIQLSKSRETKLISRFWITNPVIPGELAQGSISSLMRVPLKSTVLY